MVGIYPNDYDTSVICFLIQGKCKVDTSEYIKPIAFVIPFTTISSYVVLFIILKMIPLNTRRTNIVRIIIVLSAELSLIKVLCSLSGQNLLIETKPLTVWSDLARPDILA